MLLTRKDISSLFNMGLRAVAEALGEVGAPASVNKAAPGVQLQYKGDEVITFMVERMIRRRIGDNAKQYDLSQERARLAEKQRHKLELDMELKRGDFINRGEALEGFRHVIYAVRNKFLAVPSKAAARIDTCRNKVEVEAMIEDLVYDVLTECSTPKILEEPEQ